MRADQDTVALEVAGRRIENFTRYRIESDLFKASDDFSFDFELPGFDISPGDRCRVLVNDVLELNGIIDRVKDGYGPDGTTLSVAGRDLMGLLVDSHVGIGKTDQNIDLRALAKDLLKDVPFINRKAIIYGKGHKVKVAEQGWDFEAGKVQRDPDHTIFDLLSRHAQERGLLFWCQADGTFVFGRPVSTGKPLYRLVNRMGGQGNNILSSDRTRDIAGRYSKITVIGQQQGEDIFDPEAVNVQAVVYDKEIPFHKPYCTCMHSDMASPSEYAAMVLNQQRFDGFSLDVVVAGHSLGGVNFQANTLCHVDDEYYGYSKSFFIAARTFELGQNGIVTSLRLSEPGVVPS